MRRLVGLVVVGALALGACGGGKAAPPADPDAAFLAAVHEANPQWAANDELTVNFGHVICDGVVSQHLTIAQLQDQLDAAAPGFAPGKVDEAKAQTETIVRAAVRSYCPSHLGDL